MKTNHAADPISPSAVCTMLAQIQTGASGAASIPNLACENLLSTCTRVDDTSKIIFIICIQMQLGKSSGSLPPFFNLQGA